MQQIKNRNGKEIDIESENLNLSKESYNEKLLKISNVWFLTLLRVH